MLFVLLENKSVPSLHTKLPDWPVYLTAAQWWWTTVSERIYHRSVRSTAACYSLLLCCFCFYIHPAALRAAFTHSHTLRVSAGLQISSSTGHFASPVLFLDSVEFWLPACWVVWASENKLVPFCLRPPALPTVILTFSRLRWTHLGAKYYIPHLLFYYLLEECGRNMVIWILGLSFGVWWKRSHCHKEL